MWKWMKEESNKMKKGIIISKRVELYQENVGPFIEVTQLRRTLVFPSQIPMKNHQTS